jgi:hypothetical protein
MSEHFARFIVVAHTDNFDERRCFLIGTSYEEPAPAKQNRRALQS